MSDMKAPDRDCMAEVAKLIGCQPTPEIMEVQGYDWSSDGWKAAIRLAVSGVPFVYRIGDGCVHYDVLASERDSATKA